MGGRQGGGKLPVAVAAVCLVLAAWLAATTLVPALLENRSLARELEEAQRRERRLKEASEENRAVIEGLLRDPQEVLRALDEQGLAPPEEPTGR